MLEVDDARLSVEIGRNARPEVVAARLLSRREAGERDGRRRAKKASSIDWHFPGTPSLAGRFVCWP